MQPIDINDVTFLDEEDTAPSHTPTVEEPVVDEMAPSHTPYQEPDYGDPTSTMGPPSREPFDYPNPIQHTTEKLSELKEKYVPEYESTEDILQQEFAPEPKYSPGEMGVGAVESASDILGTAVSFPISGWQGLISLAYSRDPEHAAKVVEDTMALPKTLREKVMGPTSEAGEKLTESVMLPFELWHAVSQDVGDIGTDITGEPLFGWGLASLVEAVPFTYHGIKKLNAGLSKKPSPVGDRGPGWYAEAPPPDFNPFDPFYKKGQMELPFDERFSRHAPANIPAMRERPPTGGTTSAGIEWREVPDRTVIRKEGESGWRDTEGGPQLKMFSEGPGAPGGVGKGASVKAFLTNSDRAKLSEMGYTPDEIYRMKPEEGARILEEGSGAPTERTAGSMHEESFTPKDLESKQRNLKEKIDNGTATPEEITEFNAVSEVLADATTVTPEDAVLIDKMNKRNKIYEEEIAFEMDKPDPVKEKLAGFRKKMEENARKTKIQIAKNKAITYKRMQDAMVPDARSSLQKTKDWFKDIPQKTWELATREYKDLPKSTNKTVNKIGPDGVLLEGVTEAAYYAPLRNILLRLTKQRNVAQDYAGRAVQRVLKNVGENQKTYDAFSEIIALEDIIGHYDELVKRGEITYLDKLKQRDLNKMKGKKSRYVQSPDSPKLPFEFKDIDDVRKVLKDVLVDNGVRKDTTVADLKDPFKKKTTFSIDKEHPLYKAWEERKVVKNEILETYIEAMKDIGYNVKESWMSNQSYMRRLTLEHYNQVSKIQGAGKKLKTPADRPHMKHRSLTGTTSDFVTDYITHENQLFAQLLHDTQIAKSIKQITGRYDIKEPLRLEAEGMIEAYKKDPYNVPDPKFDPSVDLWEQMWDRKVQANEKAIVDLETIIKNEDRMFTQKEVDFAAEKLKNTPRLSAEYTKFQPRPGNTFFMTDPMPIESIRELFSEKVWKSMDNSTKFMIENELEKAKLTLIGDKANEFFIPTEVAKTVSNLMEFRDAHPLMKVHRKAIQYWKKWQLLSPKRAIKYNLRNLTGDADAALVGRKKLFTTQEGRANIKRAIKELSDGYKGEELTGDFKDWMDRGGSQTTLQAQEMGNLRRLSPDRRMRKAAEFETASEHIFEKGVNFAKGWGRWVREFTDYRESTLRYAAYLDILAELKKKAGITDKMIEAGRKNLEAARRKDPGSYDRIAVEKAIDDRYSSKDVKPDEYGASFPEEINALADIRDKAFWMSNELLGAYDRVGSLGQGLREQWIPFWSWKEVNAKRYKNIARNIATDQKAMTDLGLHIAGKKIPIWMASTAGIFAFRAMTFNAMLDGWNNLAFREEEKSLPDEVRKRPHVILGTDDKGEVRYFSRLGAFGDILEWFDFATPTSWAIRLFDGDSAKEIIDDMAKEAEDFVDPGYYGDKFKAVFNELAQGMLPIERTIGETFYRRKLFPDIFQPRPIREPMKHLIWDQLHFPEVYDWITNKPSNRNLATDLTMYKTDPYESAYFNILSKKHEFLKDIGKGADSFFLSDKGNALYNAKKAMRFNDKEKTTYWINKYVSLGGDIDYIDRAVENMDPLFRIKDEEMDQFYDSLNSGEKKDLVKAMEYFEAEIKGSRDLSKERLGSGPEEPEQEPEMQVRQAGFSESDIEEIR